MPAAKCPHCGVNLEPNTMVAAKTMQCANCQQTFVEADCLQKPSRPQLLSATDRFLWLVIAVICGLCVLFPCGPAPLLLLITLLKNGEEASLIFVIGFSLVLVVLLIRLVVRIVRILNHRSDKGAVKPS